jgi:RHS repeat-associated protein
MNMMKHSFFTRKNYTKHYFMGAERFCTTVGGGNDGNWLVSPYDNLTQQEQGLLTTLRDDYTYQHTYYDIYDYGHYNNQTHNTDYTGTVESGDQLYDYYQYYSDEQYYGNISFEFKQPFADDFDKYYKNDEMDEPYYYHSDHLGSAAWITDAKGSPVQYIMYAPYGEQRLNQQPFAYEERFTFTGKERDIETGYDYFGARNYLSALSIWGAVDPLANKYIYNSPYVYCDGNPIKFVDPDGKEKYIFLNPIEDVTLVWGAINYTENIPTIHIWAHGNPSSIHFYNPVTRTVYQAENAEMVLDYLKHNVFNKSKAWAIHELKETQAVIVLHVCETGKGDNSIAQQLSGLLPNTIIIAPTENVAVNPTNLEEEGAYKTIEEENASGEKTYFKASVGAWVIYKNKEKIGSFNGASKPNVTNPKTFHVNDDTTINK